VLKLDACYLQDKPSYEIEVVSLTAFLSEIQNYFSDSLGPVDIAVLHSTPASAEALWQAHQLIADRLLDYKFVYMTNYGVWIIPSESFQKVCLVVFNLPTFVDTHLVGPVEACTLGWRKANGLSQN
jgi:hypothetical protein